MLRLSKSRSMRSLKISAPMSPPPPLPVKDNIEHISLLSNDTPPSRKTSMSSTPRSSPENAIVLITKFDFKAENRNELTVGVGEAVKLLERKGNGWILVKPIGRISDPGLIPASYVKIVRLNNKDHLCDKIDEKWLSSRDDVSPPVSRANTKLRSESQNQHTLLKRPSMNSSTTSHSPQSSVSSSPRTRDNKYSSVDTSTSESCNGDNASIEPTYFTFQSPHSSISRAVTPSNGLDAVPVSGLVRNANSYNGRYWYRVDINMSDGKRRYICRYYQDFYKLHCNLVDQLLTNKADDEDEDTLIEKLPSLPEPIPRPDLQTLSNILLQRCQSLNVYIFKIVQNKQGLDYGDVLNEWVKPRLGDLELSDDTTLSNDSIEELLKPIPTNVNVPKGKPQLSVQTAVTPPLPAPQGPPVSSYYHHTPRSASVSSVATSINSPTSSPQVWQSPTMNSPTFRADRANSTPTIHEDQELKQDWMSTPTEPLCVDRAKKQRNMSCPSMMSTTSSLNSPLVESEDQWVKMKVYYVEDIFALKFQRGKSSIVDVKNSIAKRLECEVTALRLYYKNPAKNYFSPLVDEMDLEAAFERAKVSVKVHIWDDRV